MKKKDETIRRFIVYNCTAFFLCNFGSKNKTDWGSHFLDTSIHTFVLLFSEIGICSLTRYNFMCCVYL